MAISSSPEGKAIQSSLPSPPPQAASSPTPAAATSETQSSHKRNTSNNQGSRFPPCTSQNDRQCTNCGETVTSQWRGTLCNACALWKRSRGTDRPLPLLFSVKRKSLTPSDEAGITMGENAEYPDYRETISSPALQSPISPRPTASNIASPITRAPGHWTTSSSPALGYYHPSLTKPTMPHNVNGVFTYEPLRGHTGVETRERMREYQDSKDMQDKRLKIHSPRRFDGFDNIPTRKENSFYPQRLPPWQPRHAYFQAYPYAYAGYPYQPRRPADRQPPVSPDFLMSREGFLHAAEWLHDTLVRTSRLLERLQQEEFGKAENNEHSRS
ncbi:uncharacterized protein L203_105596 [Cryptococcus depauperatus CBS 7841]|uniref:Uncharacterized protein n=1 Tax=Cryptococcus depauperatus CBS 7841 TaxID=1295531 RepID=A0A1E3IHI6_9TREE|nr:hypothetical protein L203_03473 [Cryptococcus depauperatus CBS 7841]